MRSRRRLVLVALFLLLPLGVLVASSLAPVATRGLAVANGYAAKWACSNVFVGGRGLDAAVADLPPNPLTSWVDVTIEHDATVVEARVTTVARRAVYRPGLGCTLLPPELEPADLASPAATPDVPIVVEPWPVAFDPALDPVLDRAFAEPYPERRRNTRAVVVIHRGELVAERYAEGFDAASVLPGWSMTKSWTHALVGRAVRLGHLDEDLELDPSPWPEGDPRRAIDLDVLLRMSSGLAFDEDYGDLQSTALRMLFIEPDMGAYAAEQPLDEPVDTSWYYSSGTTNLVSRQLRLAVGDEASWHFPREALFAPLGMASAVVEPDASGTFVGSSYGWATARDWARFGQLYLQDGAWNGERLLPEGWAEHAATPTPGSNGRYGAHWWLNAPGDPADPTSRRWPELPADLYFASGYDGQSVVVVPSHEAVIVRLGLSQDRRAWNLGAFLGEVLDVLAERPEALDSQNTSVTTIGE